MPSTNGGLLKEATNQKTAGDAKSSQIENDGVHRKNRTEPTASWKKGTKIVLKNIDPTKQTINNLRDGMLGIVKEPAPATGDDNSNDDDSCYMVSFANLGINQKVHTSNMQKAAKRVKGVKHACVCGKPAKKMCSKCNLKWYCSKPCQEADHKLHKGFCKMATELE